jgi:hypothetical protein
MAVLRVGEKVPSRSIRYVIWQFKRSLNAEVYEYRVKNTGMSHDDGAQAW